MKNGAQWSRKTDPCFQCCRDSRCMGLRRSNGSGKRMMTPPQRFRLRARCQSAHCRHPDPAARHSLQRQLAQDTHVVLNMHSITFTNPKNPNTNATNGNIRACHCMPAYQCNRTEQNSVAKLIGASGSRSRARQG